MRRKVAGGHSLWPKAALVQQFQVPNQQVAFLTAIPVINKDIFVQHIRPFLSDEFIKAQISSAIDDRNPCCLHVRVGTKVTIPACMKLLSHGDFEVEVDNDRQNCNTK